MKERTTSEAAEGAFRVLQRFATREFPYYPSNYKGNIFAYLKDAYRHLRTKGFEGEPITHPLINNPVCYMEISQIIFDINQSVREKPLTLEQLNRPCRAPLALCA